MSSGRALQAVPIYLPADAKIPAPAVPARDHVVRPFVADKSILQREARKGALGAVLPAYVVLALIIGAELAALAYGLRRLRRSTAPAADETRFERGAERRAGAPLPA
jgi:hypothetical protein